MLTAAVALAGGLGAVLRYLVDSAVTRRRRGPFPLGTFVVNVAGAFVLGLVTAAAAHGRLAAGPQALLGPGLCAGFTTFSTWMWETVALWRAGDRRRAVANLAGPVLAGGVAAAAGLALGAA